MPGLVEKLKGNWAVIHPSDAAQLGLREGERAKIRSACGELEIEVRPSPEMARGVVAVHQHWGHVYEFGMTTARKYPGVNVNCLHSDTVRDPFCAMPVYNGTSVALEHVVPT